MALVPGVGFVMMVVLGVKGNEWAWRNRRWESLEQFKRTQRLIGPGVSCECVEERAGSQVNEDHFLPKAVDPVSAARPNVACR